MFLWFLSAFLFHTCSISNISGSHTRYRLWTVTQIFGWNANSCNRLTERTFLSQLDNSNIQLQIPDHLDFVIFQGTEVQVALWAPGGKSLEELYGQDWLMSVTHYSIVSISFVKYRTSRNYSLEETLGSCLVKTCTGSKVYYISWINCFVLGVTLPMVIFQEGRMYSVSELRIGSLVQIGLYVSH